MIWLSGLWVSEAKPSTHRGIGRLEALDIDISQIGVTDFRVSRT